MQLRESPIYVAGKHPTRIQMRVVLQKTRPYPLTQVEQFEQVTHFQIRGSHPPKDSDIELTSVRWPLYMPNEILKLMLPPQLPLHFSLYLLVDHLDFLLSHRLLMLFVPSQLSDLVSGSFELDV